MKTISQKTFITLQGLLVMTRRKAAEVEAITELQLDLVATEFDLTISDRDSLKDHLMDVTWGASDTEDMLTRCGIAVEDH